jgi:hypothetical protein
MENGFSLSFGFETKVWLRLKKDRNVGLIWHFLNLILKLRKKEMVFWRL